MIISSYTASFELSFPRIGLSLNGIRLNNYGKGSFDAICSNDSSSEVKELLKSWLFRSSKNPLDFRENGILNIESKVYEVENCFIVSMCSTPVLDSSDNIKHWKVDSAIRMDLTSSLQQGHQGEDAPEQGIWLGECAGNSSHNHNER